MNTIKNLIATHRRGSAIALVTVGTLTACAIAAGALVAFSAGPDVASPTRTVTTETSSSTHDSDTRLATPEPSSPTSAPTPESSAPESSAPEAPAPAQPVVEDASGVYYATTALRIREAASADSAIVEVLAAGDKIEVDGKQGQWLRLRDGRGWSTSEFLTTDAPVAPEKPAGPAAPQMEAASGTLYTTTALRIRTEANSSSAIVSTLPAGTAVKVDGKQNGWYHLADGRGWLSGQYLSSSAPAPQQQASAPSTAHQIAESEAARFGMTVRWGALPNGWSGMFSESEPSVVKLTTDNWAIRHGGEFAVRSLVRHEAAHAAIFRICGTTSPAIAGARYENVTDAYADLFHGGITKEKRRDGVSPVVGYGYNAQDAEVARAIHGGRCS